MLFLVQLGGPAVSVKGTAVAAAPRGSVATDTLAQGGIYCVVVILIFSICKLALVIDAYKGALLMH